MNTGRTTVVVELGDDFDAYLSEAGRNDRPPGLVVSTGQTELILVLGPDTPLDACDRISQAIGDWRASLTEMTKP